MLSCLECLPDISPRRPWRQMKIGKKYVFFMDDSVQKTIEDFILSLRMVTRKCSIKKVFLKIWQNSQENICAGVSF